MVKIPYEIKEMAYSISRLSSLRLNYVSETSVRLHRSKRNIEFSLIASNHKAPTSPHVLLNVCSLLNSLRESPNARIRRKASQNSAHGN
jgi:hypothetical protein